MKVFIQVGIKANFSFSRTKHLEKMLLSKKKANSEVSAFLFATNVRG